MYPTPAPQLQDWQGPILEVGKVRPMKLDSLFLKEPGKAPTQSSGCSDPREVRSSPIRRMGSVGGTGSVFKTPAFECP